MIVCEMGHPGILVARAGNGLPTVATALRLQPPPTLKTKQAVQSYIAENVIRDRTRWSLPQYVASHRPSLSDHVKALAERDHGTVGPVEDRAVAVSARAGERLAVWW